MAFSPFVAAPAPQSSPRKRGMKVGKKIERINTIFRGLPKTHKTAQYYRALCTAAGIPEAVVDRSCSVALSLIEGST